jgi:hypothetical protein
LNTSGSRSERFAVAFAVAVATYPTSVGVGDPSGAT